MRKLTDLAVRRKAATAAIACALVVLGVLSLTRLPVDFLPNIAYPLIKVHIWWRGATPEEIEEQIADLKARWPAHSVPPSMWQELEELEEKLEKAQES